MPGSLELKTIRWGLTPLALAFSLRRLEAAKLLLAAGADQTARKNEGNNILHLLLRPISAQPYNEKNLEVFLDLIDKRLISSLLTQRSSAEPGSLTPLARWARAPDGYAPMSADSEDEILRIMLDFAAPISNQDLEFLDGSGQTLLHYAVTQRKEAWIRKLLDCRPDLLYRENSVGRTPFELAEDAHIAICVSAESSIVSAEKYYHQSQHIPSITERSPEGFAPDHKKEKRADAEKIWRLCREYMAKNPGKRKLVSLMDANEVARRLAKRMKRPGWQGRRGSQAGDPEDAAAIADLAARRLSRKVRFYPRYYRQGHNNQGTESGRDEVAEWYGMASIPPSD